MTLRVASRLVVLLLAVTPLASLAAGCDRSVPAEDLPPAFTRAVCEHWYRCCWDDVFPMVTGAVDVEGCVETFAERDESRFVAAPGFTEYDGNAARACLDALATTECREHPWYLDECLDVLVPLVPVGGECWGSVDCESRFCDTRTRLCGEARREGASCADGRGCSSNYVCRDAVCTHQLAVECASAP